MNRIGRDFFALVANGHVPSLTGDFLDLTPSFEAHRSELKGAIFKAPNAGSARTVTFLVGGVWVAGDTIVLTLQSPSGNSRQAMNKTFRYTVPTGGTATASIATALDAMIGANDASPDQPWSSSVVGSTVTVTNKSIETRGLTGTKFVVSTAGTITVGGATGANAEGQPDDLREAGVPDELITQASYDTVIIAYEPNTPQPHIDSAGANAHEIRWFGDVGTGATLALTINNIAAYVS